MDFQSITFYVFAALLCLSAMAVITVRNPVHAVLFLVLSFFTMAAIWLLLEAEFLAIILVLVVISRDVAMIRLNAPVSLGKPFHPSA